MEPHSPQEPPVQDLQSLLITIFIFAAITAVVYNWLVSPILSLGDAPPPADRHVPAAARNRGAPAPHQHRSPQIRRRSAPDVAQDSEMLSLLTENTRCPPHIAPSSAGMSGTDGTSLLIDGMLPFRHGRASSHEQGTYDTGTVTQNRRERARLLAKVLALNNTSNGLLTIPSSSPPSRGSTLVVSICEEDVACPKSRRIIFLFATYYNLLVIVHYPPPSVGEDETCSKRLAEVVAKLHGGSGDEQSYNFILTPAILPEHRILASQSTTGRVAVVRQLTRVEFVLDFDLDVQTQLNRFGYRVFVYGKEIQLGDEKKTSLLGESLLL